MTEARRTSDVAPPYPGARVADLAGHTGLISSATAAGRAETAAQLRLPIDNIGARRALDTLMSQGGLVRLARTDGPRHVVRRLFVIAVNSERDPGFRIDESDRTPTTLRVLDSLMFGSGSQASRDTLALLRHTMRRWQHELRDEPLSPDSLFTRDAQLHVITVNPRAATARSGRRCCARRQRSVRQLVDVLRAAGGFICNALAVPTL